MRKRELDLAVQELFDILALDSWWSNRFAFGIPVLECTDTSGYHSSVDDLNGAEAGTMTSGQVLIHLIHGTTQSCVTELFVHIMRATATIVTDGNSKILDDIRVLLSDLIYTQNFPRRAFKLVHLMQKVPKSTLGLHLILGKQTHAVDLRRRVSFGRELAPYDMEVAHL